MVESIIKGVMDLGWASAKKIAEHIDLDPETVQKALEKLVEDKRVLRRKKGRGHQYGSLEPVDLTELKEEDVSIPIIPSLPPETVFSSLDEFTLQGIHALPRDHTLSAENFAKEMLKAYPNVKWSKEQIMQQIAMLVRLGRLDYRPFLEDSKMRYEYVVK